MTVWDSPVLAILAVLTVIFACCSVFVLLRTFFRNWRDHLSEFGFVAAYAVLGAVFIVAIGAVMAGVVLSWQHLQEQATFKQCLTAHERRTYADAAPDDYFGRQLREAAAAETKTCAALAAKLSAEKQAEAAKARTGN